MQIYLLGTDELSILVVDIQGSGHSPGHIPPDMFTPNISPARTIPPPFLHGVGFSRYHHHHAPIYIKRSTVNVYKIDSS